MSAIDSIVQVTITSATKAISRASFGIPALLKTFTAGTHGMTGTQRTAYYASLAEVSSAGWASTDDVYKAARAIFSQSPSVKKIMIGRADSADASLTASLNAIQAEQVDWYAFTFLGTFTDVQLTEISAWTESQTKIHFIQQTDADSFDGTLTNDIGPILKNLSYKRSAVIYHDPAKLDEYAQCAWMGNCLPFDPGSQTWAFKTLAGVTIDNLTTAQETTLKANNVNYYTATAGVGITMNGVVSSGEYIDIVRNLDWLEARLGEVVFSLLINARKVPYDDNGITMVVGAVESCLNEAVGAGVLQAGTTLVTAPKYSEIPSADKTARNLPDVKFSGLLVGAIHSTEIDGVVSL